MLVPSEWQKPSRTGGEEGGIVFFFFSSRRRHTRCSRDWSSDVCSSDLAMGVQWRTLDVPGIDRLRGAGVYYGWGTSEAISCKGETVYVIGGANSAGQAAMHFSKFAEKVVMLVRGNSLASTMSHYLIEQIEKTPKIEVWTRSSIVGVHGDARPAASPFCAALPAKPNSCPPAVFSSSSAPSLARNGSATSSRATTVASSFPARILSAMAKGRH